MKVEPLVTNSARVLLGKMAGVPQEGSSSRSVLHTVLPLLASSAPDRSSGQTGLHPQTSGARAGSGAQPPPRPLWPGVFLKAARAAGVFLGCLGGGGTWGHRGRGPRRA